MIQYLQYTDFSLVLEYVSGVVNLDIIKTFNKFNIPGVDRFGVEKWDDIQTRARSSGGFFDDGSSIFLIDIANMDFESLGKKEIAGINSIDESLQVFLYSSYKDKLLATEKNILKKIKCNIINLKKASSDKLAGFLDKYLLDLNLEIANGTKTEILKNSNNYTEVADIVDFIDLAEDEKKSISHLYKKAELPLYMRSFNISHLDRDIPKWSSIKTEDLQLAISLIYGKLDKQHGQVARGFKKDLIMTDEKIKTRGGISPILWWKLFLWKSRLSR